MRDEVDVNHQIGGEGHRRPDRRLAEIAGRQHGVVARGQLVDLGLSPRAIDRRLQSGRLHLVYRGVYAVGHRGLSREGRWMAAVLASGPGAVLSHRAAAARWGMRQSARPAIEVTVPWSRRLRPGIEQHRGSLAHDEVTTVDGIPLTTVPRTLLDLAAVIEPRELERAVNQAEVLRLGDTLALEDLMARHPGRRGVAALRRVLDRLGAGANVTRSELEARFLSFLEDAQLPQPQVNAVLQVSGHRFEADCVWRTQRLVVELDGHATHATRAAYEQDRARDRVLQAAGWRVVRVTWRQLHESPDSVAADLSALATLPRR